MKNIGLVTICDMKPNYGNRLQNYAAQKILLQMGYNVTTYIVESNYISIAAFYQYVNDYKKDKGYYPTLNLLLKEISKRSIFQKFNNTYVKIKKVKRLDSRFKTKADFFIVGSDQVWNPTWYSSHKLKKELYLLAFADRNQRISLSASFGLQDIPNEWKKYFINELSQYKELSVREKTGKKIISKLINRDATILIDPTMMLNKPEWRKLELKPKRINTDEPFILTYFLGKKRDSRADEDSLKIACKHNLNIINLLDERQLEAYDIGPREFIFLIDHASLVLTNSFHGSVFSIIFGKPFFAYDRRDYASVITSRVIDLLETWKLQYKFINNADFDNPFECDYTFFRSTIAIQQDKVKEYLFEALSGRGVND